MNFPSEGIIATSKRDYFPNARPPWATSLGRGKGKGWKLPVKPPLERD